ETEQQEIRLSRIAREAVAEVLREAYRRGQLDDEEFEERIDLAMRAKIEADIVPLTDDLGISTTGGRSGTVPTDESASRRTEDKEPLPSTSAERVVAAVGHAGNYFVPVLAPLVLFLLRDDVKPYLRPKELESLNY